MLRHKNVIIDDLFQNRYAATFCRMLINSCGHSLLGHPLPILMHLLLSCRHHTWIIPLRLFSTLWYNLDRLRFEFRILILGLLDCDLYSVISIWSMRFDLRLFCLASMNSDWSLLKTRKVHSFDTQVVFYTLISPLIEYVRKK